MTTLALSNFDGLCPRGGRAMLQQNQATQSHNTKLQSGEIRPWKRPVKAYHAKQADVQTIFKLEGPSGQGAWAEWTVDTDVVYSPMADLNEFRTYYSEGGVCKKTSWTLAHDGPNDAPLPRNWYHLGVPRPSQAPTLTAVLDEDQTPANTENRAYVWTFVSTFGNVKEEGCPSDPALVKCSIAGGSVTVSGFPEAPTDHYNITGLRLYRAINGASEIVYLLVDEFVYKNGEVSQTDPTLNKKYLSNSEYSDTSKAADLGITLESLYYQEPPEGLRGLVNMPNGMIAGFVGNQIWFCEPYLPHAWPSNYMLTTDAQIVGLGVYGNTLVVCTERHPFTCYGTHPSAMTQEKLPMNQPCVNKRSIAYDQYGVIYASANGLVVIAGGQMDVFTRDLMTRDDWQSYNPTIMVGTMHNNYYMCSYKVNNDTRTLVFARGDRPSLVEIEIDSKCFFVERITGDVYFLSRLENIVYKTDASTTNAMTYSWMSKLFCYPRSVSFSCAKVDGEFLEGDYFKMLALQREEIIAKNEQTWTTRIGRSLDGCPNDPMVNTYEINGGVLLSVPEVTDARYIDVEFYAEDKLYYTKRVMTAEAFRLPRKNAYNHSVRFKGQLTLRSFMMATSMAELQG